MPPVGRPTKIDQVLRTRQRVHPVTGHVDTENVTVADTIVEALRAGNYLEAAAAMAGVHRDTVHTWLKTGAQAHADLHAGTRTRRQLTKLDKLCMEFSDAVAEAQDQAEGLDVGRLAQLAAGGITQEVVTEKQVLQGEGDQAKLVVTERTVRKSTTLPDGDTLRWRLERRFPDRWGRRRVELTGADGGPVEVDLVGQGVSQLLDLAGRMADPEEEAVPAGAEAQ